MNSKVTVVLGYTRVTGEILDISAGFSDSPILGFAVDLGSTRLAFYLVDLESGKVLDEHPPPIHQIPYGEDILTRIMFARRTRTESSCSSF